ncbi:MAG: nicotinate-nucleotide adenylyltransferase [Gemmobacter sp.]|nr:nicotinate-nucleotide adenylyltransferase [Gemmobacter sp.]
MRAGFPIAMPGQVIGLLGGSFDPAHDGHVAITRAALARFGLDRVWWLVSPGNPLKRQGPAPLATRIAVASDRMRHPRVVVTGLETALGTRFTADTLARLHAIYPQVRFVWLMGSDNLASFHHWDNWRGIAATTAIGVLARPGTRLSARFAPAARALAAHRLPEAQAQRLGRTAAPAWCMVDLPLNPASSSAIRARGLWSR